MKIAITLLPALYLLAACNTEPQAPGEATSTGDDCDCTATVADFSVLEGGEWSGELEYLNYGSDQRSSIPVSLRVETVADGSVTYSIRYPGEEQYNATERLTISDDGTSIDGRRIVDRQAVDGSLIITTEGKGEDDNRPADIQIAYFVSPDEFRIRKNVRFDGEAEFFNRNEYRYVRD